MKILVSVLLATSSVFGVALLETPKVKTKDLQLLTGPQWTGTLTYKDYRTNKDVSIPSNLTVIRSDAGKLSWAFDYQYPDEPKANSNETVTISKDGTTIDGEKVIERTGLVGNTVRIVTEKAGLDNNKNASFRFTYLLNATKLSIKKEVRYEGTAEFFFRDQYSWKRSVTH